MRAAWVDKHPKATQSILMAIMEAHMWCDKMENKDELAAITGQKPILRRARKSIAAFKLREGQPVGCTVTLRGKRMFEFIDRLVNIALPRVRDFRGVPTRSFDGRGNYTMGLEDQLIFPEIDFSKVGESRGMNITFVTTAGNDQGARRLLELLGVPFRRQ